MPPLLARFEALLFDPPRVPLGRPGRAALGTLRYLYALIRDLALGDLNMRAMSLVYTTLLSVVPLLAFCFAIVKAFGFHREFEPLIAEFFRPLGERGPELTARVVSFVDHLQGGVLGSLGLAVLLWTVISVVQKVEDAFNHVWHVDRPRSFARRFAEYLSVLIVVPILMAAALGLVASIANRPLLAWLEAHPPLGLLVTTAGRLGPLLVVTAGFAFLYSFVPNTRVRARSALLAGAAAAAAWVVASFAFTRLVAYSTEMMAVYAGFAIVLLALMWIWLNWLILLTGALFAFYLQNPAYLRPGDREIVPTPRLRERLALSVMLLVTRAFEAGGERPRVATLAEALEVPSIALGPVVDALLEAGLLETTDREQLLPGRDPARITLDEVLAAVRDGGHGRAMTLRHAALVPGAEDACARVERAIRLELAGRSLRDLAVPPAEAPAAGPPGPGPG
ncbi:MAG: YihY/virulence factor BrkB family protein [Proteobacteria bacterium]|nr:YihY/virulence factor BrkB family protein [Pseudomonadota bacterium]